MSSPRHNPNDDESLLALKSAIKQGLESLRTGKDELARQKNLIDFEWVAISRQYEDLKSKQDEVAETKKMYDDQQRELNLKEKGLKTEIQNFYKEESILKQREQDFYKEVSILKQKQQHFDKEVSDLQWQKHEFGINSASLQQLEAALKTKEAELSQERDSFHAELEQFYDDKEQFKLKDSRFEAKNNELNKERSEFAQKQEQFNQEKEKFDQEKEKFDQEKEKFDQEKEKFDQEKFAQEQEKFNRSSGRSNVQANHYPTPNLQEEISLDLLFETAGCNNNTQHGTIMLPTHSSSVNLTGTNNNQNNNKKNNDLAVAKHDDVRILGEINVNLATGTMNNDSILDSIFQPNDSFGYINDQTNIKNNNNNIQKEPNSHTNTNMLPGLNRVATNKSSSLTQTISFPSQTPSSPLSQSHHLSTPSHQFTKPQSTTPLSKGQQQRSTTGTKNLQPTTPQLGKSVSKDTSNGETISEQPPRSKDGSYKPAVTVDGDITQSDCNVILYQMDPHRIFLPNSIEMPLLKRWPGIENNDVERHNEPCDRPGSYGWKIIEESKSKKILFISLYSRFNVGGPSKDPPGKADRPTLLDWALTEALESLLVRGGVLANTINKDETNSFEELKIGIPYGAIGDDWDDYKSAILRKAADFNVNIYVYKS